MLEFMTVLALLGGALLVAAVIAVIGVALKVAFKLVLLPFWLLGVVLKGLLVVGALLLAVAIAPLLLLLAVIVLPLAVLAGFAGFGVWVVA